MPGADTTEAPRPVILLHGWTMAGRVFDDLIARLGPGFRCFAPDLAGHGAAAHLPPTLATAAAQVAALIAREGLRDVLLVGWSMGAAVAWTYARDHGTTALTGLVSIDMSPRMANGPGWPHGLLGQSAEDVAASTHRFEIDWEGGAQAIAATMFATPEGAPGFDREAALAQVLSNDPGRMVAMWRALVAMDLREAIGHIDVPVLACHGAKSRVYPASAARWLAETAPNGELCRFEESGHSPHLEEPETFAAALRGFSTFTTGEKGASKRL